MKKIIIIGVVLLFVSCGSIKKYKESNDTELKTESNSGTDINRWISSSNYSLEPVDLSKPIVFTNDKGEKQTFENTKIFNNNTHTREIIKDTTAKKTDYKNEVDIKDKEVDNTKLFLGIFAMGFGSILIIIVIVIYVFSKKMNTILETVSKINS